MDKETINVKILGTTWELKQYVSSSAQNQVTISAIFKVS